MLLLTIPTRKPIQPGPSERLRAEYLDSVHCGQLWDESGEPVSAASEWSDYGRLTWRDIALMGCVSVAGCALWVISLAAVVKVFRVVAGLLETWRW